jgi:diguanylate cyclase (GGDEF)-like protein
VAGAIAFAAADSWYLAQVASDTYQGASPVDATWSVGLCLIGLAATMEQGRTVAVAEIRSFGLPAVFAATSIVVLGVDAYIDISPVSTALAVGALLAAFGRTVLAVREVVALADSRRQARHDFLTGLPNRLAIDEMLRGGSSGVRPAGALLLLDLDRFKEINDALGHRTGDQLLVAVARRLSAHVPGGATLSRLGGDEFAVLLPDVGTEEAGVIAAHLRARLTDPFTVAGMTLHVDASIGVTATRQGEDAERDLARADLAMYRAKSQGTGVELYDDDRDGDAWNRLALVEDLRDALTAGDLFVELQPIVSLPDRTPAAVEALVRWTHPVRGRLAPDEFLPVVERAGLMWALTRHVLDLALDQADLLRRTGTPLPVAVNLSASDLLDAGLADVVADALHLRGLPGSALHLEITESLLIENRDLCDATLGRLRALGVQVAVDDFGTGYSSLAYLRDLPVDILKLDRSFVDQLLDHERTATIVASTITLAHDLGLRVVAEGVETAEQLAWLGERGCDTVQGYHLGRPMRSGRLAEWLDTNARERLVRLPTPGRPAPAALTC